MVKILVLALTDQGLFAIKKGLADRDAESERPEAKIWKLTLKGNNLVCQPRGFLGMGVNVSMSRMGVMKPVEVESYVAQMREHMEADLLANGAVPSDYRLVVVR